MFPHLIQHREELWASYKMMPTGIVISINQISAVQVQWCECCFIASLGILIFTFPCILSIDGLLTVFLASDSPWPDLISCMHLSLDKQGWKARGPLVFRWGLGRHWRARAYLFGLYVYHIDAFFRRFLKWSVYLRLAYPEMYTVNERDAEDEV